MEAQRAHIYNLTPMKPYPVCPATEIWCPFEGQSLEIQGYQTKQILGLQPRDKADMLGVKTIEFFLEELTWK